MSGREEEKEGGMEQAGLSRVNLERKQSATESRNRVQCKH